MDTIHGWISAIDGFLWGPPLLILLFGTHIFLTIRTGLMQRHLWLGLKLSIARERGATGDVSPFAALTTALAATIGTGNIVGVATAVGLGGPGAILWMWLTGVLGMATKYSEALLAVRYRVRTADGTMLGGPMYALERGLGQKWLGVLFAVFTVIASFGIGNMVQANSIATMAANNFGLSPQITGVVMAAITAAVILGGLKSIARVCEVLVPFMAAAYVLGCLAVLAMSLDLIGPAISLIVRSAFNPTAAGGGFAGATVVMAARYGVARGLFSNESGLGSAPIVAAAAQTRNPVRQALVSATGTFWDTVVICAMTGLVVVTSIMRDPGTLGPLRGAELTSAAFHQAMPHFGPAILTLGLLTFVFSTILGWSYYGERAAEYLWGKSMITPYRIAWVIGVYAGSVFTLGFVWDFSDAANALMAIPNLIALLLLSNVIAADTRRFLTSGDIDALDESVDVLGQAYSSRTHT
ncbi:MAG: alanine/glycine:cation symporter family protein [Vicinamibacterales bacterium]